MLNWIEYSEIKRRFILLLFAFFITACQKTTRESDNQLLRILAIGNSYSQDALAYVPFIMQNMDVGVDVHIGILMMSSSTVANHVDNFENEKEAYTFYLFEGGKSWSIKNIKTIQGALSSHWDIILISGISLRDRYSSNHPDLNRLVDCIQSSINYPVQYVWMLSQVRPALINSGANSSEDSILSRFSETAAYAKRILNETPIEMIIPVGTAIQNARTVLEFKRMGDYANNPNNTSGNGYLCAYDGVHLQEGLPCQIAAYSCVITILDMLGIDIQEILKDDTRITNKWLSGKSVPGPHGTPLGSTDLNCELAQRCAIAANDNPYSVTTILSN